ncbi:MAG TPA: 3'-5' exonuclease, partial [Bacteroidales bacterium]|nr:3'-5' exonuclease [Bacteroidales bacterium]
NIIKKIEYLQEMNYKPGDIMILVRKNDEGSDIVRQIIQYSQSAEAKPGIIYDVISSDALFVSSNKAVRLIISFLRYIADNKNKLAFTEAAYIYYLHSKLISDEEISFNFKTYSDYLEKTIKPIETSVRQLLLHELVDTIISTLSLNTNVENIPFLNSFRDIIHEFSTKNPADINSFLEYWDESGAKLNLKIPEKQNAINIISIHKAKGLAADFVFIPFCDWKMVHNDDIIWAKTDNPPFNALPVWPVSFNNKLSNSLFCDDFYLHKFQQTVETFNMMYVAFTRARKGLFISATDQTDKNFNSIYSVLKNVLSEPQFASVSKLANNRNAELGYTEYQSGEIEKTIKKEENNKYFSTYPVYISKKQIKVKSFFDRDKVDVSSVSTIHKGIIYHKVFENIKTHNDIDKAVRKLYYSGQIRQSEVIEISNEIKSIISAGYIKHWFDGSYKIINETEIITNDHAIKRPDRVMLSDDETIVVDYKFGFNENNKYIKQTKDYANLLGSMGYKNIKLYIWYVMSGYLIKIDVNSNKTEKIDL